MMLKRFFTLNFLDAFIAGMTVVLIPLLMQSKGISVEAIGLAFALAPLFKVFVRLAGAALADFAGDKVIYLSNSGFNLLQSICYIFASSPSLFAAGKIFDGIRESLIFTVNRASLMAASPEKRHFVLAELLSGRFVYNAVGGLAVGLLFSIGGFSLPLVLMAVLSAYMVVSSLRLKNIHPASGTPRLSDFSPFGRSRMFCEAAAAFSVGSVVYTAMLYMLIPIYFSLRGFSLAEIGVFYSAYFLLMGLAMNLLSNRKISSRAAAIFGAAVFAIAAPGIFLSPNSIAPFFFVLMAAGDASLAVLWEEMNYLTVKHSRKRASDMAVLNTPAYFSVFAATALSGFAVSFFGYAPIFAAFAMSEVAFAAWGLRIVCMKD